MKNALRKCKENNMSPTSQKRIVNVIAKNLGISFNKNENVLKKGIKVSKVMITKNIH